MPTYKMLVKLQLLVLRHFEGVGINRDCPSGDTLFPSPPPSGNPAPLEESPPSSGDRG